MDNGCAGIVNLHFVDARCGTVLLTRRDVQPDVAGVCRSDVIDRDVRSITGHCCHRRPVQIIHADLEIEIPGVVGGEIVVCSACTSMIDNELAQIVDSA